MLPIQRRDLPGSAPRRRSCCGGLVHGDYHGANVGFRDGRVAAVFDLDVIHPGPFVEDLGRALFCFTRVGRAAKETRPELAGVFLDAYDQVRPLGAAERQALPLRAPLAWPRTASRYRLARELETTWRRRCASTWPGCGRRRR